MPHLFLPALTILPSNLSSFDFGPSGIFLLCCRKMSALRSSLSCGLFFFESFGCTKRCTTIMFLNWLGKQECNKFHSAANKWDMRALEERNRRTAGNAFQGREGKAGENLEHSRLPRRRRKDCAVQRSFLPPKLTRKSLQTQIKNSPHPTPQ